ncbi:MAG: RNA chaperone Hfq [bacterium]|nr:RNA chaperone Hfq [bacterium]
MENESQNLQNQFFNAARKGGAPITVFLSNGKKLIGKLKSFDKFTLLLENHHGEMMVFKHAVSTVSPSVRNDGPPGERRGPSGAGGRPPHR